MAVGAFDVFTLITDPFQMNVGTTPVSNGVTLFDVKILGAGLTANSSIEITGYLNQQEAGLYIPLSQGPKTVQIYGTPDATSSVECYGAEDVAEGGDVGISDR